MNNDRSKRDHAATGRYHNASNRVLALKDSIRIAHEALDAQVQKEFPMGTVVTVENRYQAARGVRGQVVGYWKSSSYRGAMIQVRNERTGTVRDFYVAGDYIYRED